VTEPGAEVELLAVALDKLSALRLVAVDGRVVRSRPAIARFALDKPTIRETKPAQIRPARIRQAQTRKATADAASAPF